jgi:hypothetical protein
MKNGRVRGLHYAVTWVARHPLEWMTEAFPASYNVNGWELQLEERHLTAVPTGVFSSEEDARAALGPILDAWTAQLELDLRLVVAFSFVSASIDHGDGREVSAAEVAAVAFNATVEIRHGRPPGPDGSWWDTETTRAARYECLRPMRNGNIAVSHAAYWLATHLETWGSDLAGAADKLHVSRSYLGRTKEWGARSSDRKVSLHSQDLTDEQKQSLRESVEELVRRLHLAESNLSPGEYRNLSDWP